MSQRETFEEKRRHWREKVEQQRASGLIMSKWCREQQIDYRHFLYWNERFGLPKTVLTQAAFEELKAPIENASVIIEYQGMRVLVSEASNPKALVKCLQALKGISC